MLFMEVLQLECFLKNSESYVLNEFEFSDGTVLNDVEVEYLTVGTPKYDENGNICNAVVYCHGSGGSYSSVKKLADLAYSGGPFDKNKYFFISLSGLGSSKSCSPSTTGLYYNFPQYDVVDMVNFQKKFLEDKFNISHIKGIIGNSMGGFVALTWAALYPEYMDFIIALVTSYKTAGHNYILSKVIDDIIKSDPDYGIVEDSDSLRRTLKLASEAIFNYGMSQEFYRNQTLKEIDDSMEEFLEEELSSDIYDVKYQNDAMIKYDIEDLLKNIKAKVLIVGVNQDQYFPPKLDAIPMSKMIEDSKLVIIDSELGHLGVSSLEGIRNELDEFIKGA